MRSFINISIVAILSLFLLSGCANKPKEPTKEDFRCKWHGVLAPKWTCNPQANGYIAEVGIAKPNAGHDVSFQRSEALADGRDKLASQVRIKVANLFKQYKGTTGSGKASTFDKATSSVSKQLTNETLSGSKSIEMWIHPTTKEMYLLVVIKTSKVGDNMKQAIKTSFKNEQAMYQRFLASQANGELNRELEKASE